MAVSTNLQAALPSFLHEQTSYVPELLFVAAALGELVECSSEGSCLSVNSVKVSIALHTFPQLPAAGAC